MSHCSWNNLKNLRSDCPSQPQNPPLAPYYPLYKGPSPQPGRDSFWPPNGPCSCDVPAEASSLKPQEGRRVSESSQDPPSVPRAPSSPSPSPCCLSSQFILPLSFLGGSSGHMWTFLCACLGFYSYQVAGRMHSLGNSRVQWGGARRRTSRPIYEGWGCPSSSRKAEWTGSPLVVDVETRRPGLVCRSDAW